MNDQISLLIIYTGGTIGMIKDPKTGSLKPFNFDGVYDQIPELKRFHYRLEFHCFDPLIDSSDMNPERWAELAGIIEKNYEDFDGFVVLHGSDTMAYTASALSFMLENLNKPVIFTGSQLPLGVLRTDGRENFITAIELAAATEDNTPLLPEVCTYFENNLLRANRTTKYNAENFNAFVSPNYPPLAEVGVYIKYNRHNILKPNFKKLRAHKAMDPHIAILKLFPGISIEVVEATLHIPGLKAVILETFGSGNATTDKRFIKALEKAIQNGLHIINISQCPAGAVEQGKYDTSLAMKDIGVIGGGDMTTEAALTKTMYLLGRNEPPEKFRAIMNLSLRGEITVR